MTGKGSSNYVCRFISIVMAGTLPPHYKKILVYASGTTITAHSENHTEDINTLCGEIHRLLFYCSCKNRVTTATQRVYTPTYTFRM
jgi:hypothetical protein